MMCKPAVFSSISRSLLLNKASIPCIDEKVNETSPEDRCRHVDGDNLLPVL